MDAIVAGSTVSIAISGLPSCGGLGGPGPSRSRSYTQARQADGHRAVVGSKVHCPDDSDPDIIASATPLPRVVTNYEMDDDDFDITRSGGRSSHRNSRAIGREGWLGYPSPRYQHGRDERLACFRGDFGERLDADAEFRTTVADLPGQALRCVCTPHLCPCGITAAALTDRELHSTSATERASNDWRRRDGAHSRGVRRCPLQGPISTGATTWRAAPGAVYITLFVNPGRLITNEEGLISSNMSIVRINRDEGTITPTGETLIKGSDFVTIHSRSGVTEKTLQVFTGD